MTPEMLQQLRRARLIKQDNLAEMLYVQPSAISNWERGEDAPGTVMQRRMRDILRVARVPAESLQLLAASANNLTVVRHGLVIAAPHQSLCRFMNSRSSDLVGRSMLSLGFGDEHSYYARLAEAYGALDGDVSLSRRVIPVEVPSFGRRYREVIGVPIMVDGEIMEFSRSEIVPESTFDSFAAEHGEIELVSYDDLVA